MIGRGMIAAMFVSMALAGCIGGEPLEFQDVGPQWGLTYVPSDALEKVNQNVMPSLAGGIAVGDVNGDRLPDVYVIDQGPNALYLNHGDHFVDETSARGATDDGDGRSALFADLDNDGDQDLIVANVDGAPRLLRNDGSGQFTESSGAFPVASILVSSVTAADVDNDGDLDVAVGQYGANAKGGGPDTMTTSNNGNRNHLFINDGTGQFTEGSVEAGLTSTRFTFVMSFGDVDQDGDADMYECNDFGWDILWINDGSGHYAARDGETDGIGGNRNCMGVTWTDPDLDGDWDIFITNIFVDDVDVPSLQGNQYFRQNSDGTFKDIRGALGTAESGWCWGIMAFDADNDGDEDLAIANGFMTRPGVDTYAPGSITLVPHEEAAGQMPPWLQRYDEDQDIRFGTIADKSARNGPFGGGQEDKLYRNDGGRFVDQAGSSWAPGVADGRNVAILDVDGDGDLDFLHTAWKEPVRLFENQLGGDSIRLHFQGTESNRDGIGTTVLANVDGAQLIREQRAGSGFYSQSESVVHVGLSDAATADLRIRWPSGTIQTFTGVEAGHYLVVESADSLTVL